MYITRRIEFSASHVCRLPNLPDAENEALYGEEANPHGHGHNYAVEVTVEGDPDPTTGMVFDLKELKHILEREIVQPMDHRFLNCEVPPFNTVVPTAENLAVEVWKRLASSLNAPGRRLHQIRVYETGDFFVDYFGGTQ